MTNETLKASIIEQIDNLNESDLVNLNNRFCCEANYNDSEIYNNDEEFFNMMLGNNPMSAARAVFYGDYDYSCEYVKFNGYGNLESIRFMTTDELADTVENIAEFAIENQHEFKDLLDFSEEETTETESE